MDPSHPSEPQEMSLLEKLEQRIGYQFKDKGLLLSSLTHASGAEHRLASNERRSSWATPFSGPWSARFSSSSFPNSSKAN